MCASRFASILAPGLGGWGGPRNFSRRARSAVQKENEKNWMAGCFGCLLALRTGLGAPNCRQIAAAPRMGNGETRWQERGNICCVSRGERQGAGDRSDSRDFRNDRLGGRRSRSVRGGGLYRGRSRPAIGNGSEWRTDQGYPVGRRRADHRQTAAGPDYGRSQRGGRLWKEAAGVERQSVRYRLLLGRRADVPLRD